ncbi:unnamed protein product [Allacma fusca]|uniref:Uncharacterized protein n=1 Tax=Allacma fusca TaxID=39272 RepID=A0A8J2KXA7_9HEXA|nr:unnamed protein product [Allacma fusca]
MNDALVLKIGIKLLVVMFTAAIVRLLRHAYKNNNRRRLNQEIPRQQHNFLLPTGIHNPCQTNGRVTHIASATLDYDNPNLAYEILEIPFPSTNPGTQPEGQVSLSSAVLIVRQPILTPSNENNSGLTFTPHPQTPPPDFSTALKESLPVFPSQPISPEELPPSYDDYVKSQSSVKIP